MNDIIEMITTTNDVAKVKNLIEGLHEFDIANILTKLDSDGRLKIYKIFNDEKLADIFSYLDEQDACEFLEELTNAKKAAILNEMEPDDAVDILNETEDDNVDDVIKLLDKDIRDDILELEKYDEFTAGSIMTTHFIKVLAGCDIKVAMKNMVSNACDVESINTIFVVDDNDYLVGTIDLKTLIISRSPCLVDDIMDDNFKYVDIDTDNEVATKMINDYDIMDLPVLDHGIIKGIITVDDAIDSLVDEANEDYAKLAGLITDEEKSEKINKSIMKRIPWLLILLVCDLFVPIITRCYEYLFVEGSPLYIFLILEPVVLGLSGNCAMQSLGIAIRSISNNALETKKQVLKHVLKELLTGLLLGICLGLISFIVTYLMFIITKNTDLEILRVSFTVSVSIFAGLTCANIVGSMIPILFYKMKIDPASASGPFITTIIDILSAVVYFSLITVLFSFMV